jgi:hypothetical protein
MPTPARLQRGQAIAEFVVSMLIVVPLVLGVIYIGKYEDVKYTAIQASRHVAFERAFDTLPSPHESATALADETRARFFMDPMQSNNGAVAFQDAPPSSQTSGTLNANWLGTAGEDLITAYPDIKVDVQKGADLSGIGKTAFDLARTVYFSNINDPGIQSAHVQVPLANVTQFAALNNLGLKIDVSTAMLVDGFNADGNGDPTNPAPDSVRGRVSLAQKIPGLNTVSQVANNAIVQFGWEGLSDTPGPNLLCVAPDVVPGDATSSNANYDPATVCN